MRRRAVGGHTSPGSCVYFHIQTSGLFITCPGNYESSESTSSRVGLITCSNNSPRVPRVGQQPGTRGRGGKRQRKRDGKWRGTGKDRERERAQGRKREKGRERCRKRELWFYIPVQPPFLQTQTIATLCLCGEPELKVIAASLHMQAPVHSSQPVGSQRGRGSFQKTP